MRRQWSAFQAAASAATSEAEASALSATAPNPAAAAVNYVRQLSEYDLEVALLSARPGRPMFLRDPDPFAVPGSNPPERPGIYSPDNLSYIAVINPAKTYTISAKRGNSVDLSYQVISGFPGAGTTGTPTATLLRDQIQVGADGRYTLTIGGPSKSENWLPTTPQTSIVAVREAFNNWARAVPDQLSLSLAGQRPFGPKELSNTALAGAIQAATAALTQQSSYWIKLWGTTLAALPANVLRTPSPTQGGLAGQLSSLSHFQLAPGQALVVTVGRSDALYQGFEASNAFGQTLPAGNRTSSLNAEQAQLGSDGKFHFVVSGTDPGVPNWIDTQGFTQGFLFLRWQELSGSLPAQDDPVGQVVPLSEVKSVLPPGTPTVSSAQRRIQLQARATALGFRLRSSSNQAAPVLLGDLRAIASSVGRTSVARLFVGTSVPSKLSP